MPTQIAILPISDKYLDYAQKVSGLLKNYELRALVDERAEKTGRKIRDAEVSKIPYMLIVGEKEAAENTVSVRKHGGEDLGSMSLQAFVEHVDAQINDEIGEFEV